MRRFVAAALGLSAAAPLFAQTSQQASAATEVPQQGVELTEVIVTARRVEERLQDVPISITVFNQDQLTNRNVVNAADLAAFTPSLSANNNFGPENTSFAIRGFVQDAGTPPSVGVYFADVVALRGPTQGTQAGDGAGPGNFFDLQNVQVLKGPQGTLFGRNTTGGAVLFVPQKPTATTEGYVEVSAGNYSMARVQAMINLPLTDAIRFRLAMDHNQRDGYLKNISGVGPSNFDDVDYTAVRASLVADVTSNIENYTIASFSHSDTNGGVQKLIACNPSGYNFNPANPTAGFLNFLGVFSCAQLAAEQQRGAGFYDIEQSFANSESFIQQWQLINTTTWSPSDLFRIKNIASYGQYRNVQNSPLFGANWTQGSLPQPYPNIFFRGVPAGFAGITPIPGGDSADQSTYTEEVQLQGTALDSKLTYQGGVYLEWSDPLAVTGNQSAQLASCTNSATLDCTDPIGAAFTAAFGFPTHVGAVNLTEGETWYRSKGVYAQSTYSLTDRLKLTGGLRGTWDSQSNISTRITNNFAVTPPYTGVTSFCTDPNSAPSCVERLHEKSSKPTWLIDLDYKITDDVMTYGKYARGYRAGGIFANAPTDHRSFEPEKVDSYELGIKSSFLEPVHGIFNVAAFYNDFVNQAIQFGFNARQLGGGATAPVSPTTAIINAGKSRIYGVEVEAQVTPVTNLSFDLNYTYLNATLQRLNPYNTIDPNYQPGATTITAGDPLVLSPKNKASLTGTYTLPLPSTLGRLLFGATFTHTDKQLTNYVYFDPNVVAAYGGQNFNYVPSIDLLNLNLNWNGIAGTGIDVSFFATNVAGKKYYGFIPGLGSNGLETATVGEPRMYGARIKYRFGK